MLAVTVVKTVTVAVDGFKGGVCGAIYIGHNTMWGSPNKIKKTNLNLVLKIQIREY